MRVWESETACGQGEKSRVHMPQVEGGGGRRGEEERERGREGREGEWGRARDLQRKEGKERLRARRSELGAETRKWVRAVLSIPARQEQSGSRRGTQASLNRACTVAEPHSGAAAPGNAAAASPRGLSWGGVPGRRWRAPRVAAPGSPRPLCPNPGVQPWPRHSLAVRDLGLVPPLSSLSFLLCDRGGPAPAKGGATSRGYSPGPLAVLRARGRVCVPSAHVGMDLKTPLAR